jgi:hypothetical protein
LTQLHRASIRGIAVIAMSLLIFPVPSSPRVASRAIGDRLRRRTSRTGARAIVENDSAGGSGDGGDWRPAHVCADET